MTSSVVCYMSFSVPSHISTDSCEACRTCLPSFAMVLGPEVICSIQHPDPLKDPKNGHALTLQCSNGFILGAPQFLGSFRRSGEGVEDESLDTEPVRWRPLACGIVSLRNRKKRLMWTHDK